MELETSFDINEARYEFFAQLFERIESRLGLNIRVDYDDERFASGQIFLFNHFARFETIIPPYIIYKSTGVFCRSIADQALFEINDRFTRLMYDVGAVPSKMIDLLPYLAAEILRGRKIVVFPEGRMVKDRRVIDQSGALGVYSSHTGRWRGHHRGAAVLALTLDIFKQRVRELFKNDDIERIERWVDVLGLDSPEVLLSKAEEPTVIIPGSITFFPIRTDANIVSRMAERFAGDIDALLMEEILVESNLILNDTDMDIRLGNPVTSGKRWRMWERMLLNRYFRSVSSLEDLFALRNNTADTWSARLLARCVDGEVRRIRNRCMEDMYSTITVNINHAAAVVIRDLATRERTSVKRSDFQYIVYTALKRLQNIPGVNLHDSLVNPERYGGILRGEDEDIERFLKRCLMVESISISGDQLVLQSRLLKEAQPADVRVHNPVHLYANEVAPLHHVTDVIESSIDDFWQPYSVELAHARFDDEQRTYQWNLDRFSAKQYRDVNSLETATADARPYLMLSSSDSRTGVLLVHGFLASPAELADFGQDLNQQGFCVLGVRLAGHGTSPWDLKRCRWQGWLASVRNGFDILSAFVDDVVIVGFAAGGTLALLLSIEGPDKLRGVAAISPTITYRHKDLLIPLVHTLNKVTAAIPAVSDVKPFRIHESEHPQINYHQVPISALYQVRDMVHELISHAAQIPGPVLILQGTKDPLVDPAGANALFEKLTIEDKYLQRIESDHHGILNEDVGETRAVVSAFIQRVGIDASMMETGT